jgi:glycerophosphoryl diester phosphodiesterase
MSESNNNTPMRITQLEEATEYEDGMYYAVAKAGGGTKKVKNSIMNLGTKQNLSLSNNGLQIIDVSMVEGNLDSNGDITPSTGWVVYENKELFQETTTIFINGTYYALRIAIYNNDGSLYNLVKYYNENKITIPKNQKVRFAVKLASDNHIDFQTAKSIFKTYTPTYKKQRINDNALFEIETNNEPKAFTSDFYMGNMSSGVIFPYFTNRIFSDIMKYNSSVRIKAKDGFSFYIDYYEDGDFVSESSLSTDITIPADQEFSILVRGVPEFTTVNIDSAKRGVYFAELDSSEGITSAFDNNFLYNGKIRIASHMGLHDGLPVSVLLSNSIPAFENAGKHKMFGCETDLNETLDGHFVCMHNDTVDATTNGSGKIIEKTLSEIEDLYLTYNNGTVSNLKVPTFEEYLQICKIYNMIAFAEIKTVANTTTSFENFASIIKKYGMEKQTIILTNRYNLSYLRNYTNAILQLLTTGETDTASIEAAKSNSNIIISFDKTYANKNFIQNLHDNGIPCNIYTVNSKNDADTLWSYSADIITSDALTEADWMS